MSAAPAVRLRPQRPIRGVPTAGSTALNRRDGGANPPSGAGRRRGRAGPLWCFASSLPRGARSSGDDACLTNRKRRVRSSRPAPPPRRACPPAARPRQRGPTSRGGRFKPGELGVRIPPLAPPVAAPVRPRRGRRGTSKDLPSWKPNREWSRARPLPGAYREVWRSIRLASARKVSLAGHAPWRRVSLWIGGGYWLAAPVCKTGSFDGNGGSIPSRSTGRVTR